MSATPQITLEELAAGRLQGPESTTCRVRLLIASAEASRLLLESSDVMASMPQVLRVLGEAAEVERTTLALAQVGPSGERWLVIKDEWIAPGVTDAAADGLRWNERRSDCFCSELTAGRSVYLCGADTGKTSIASHSAKSSMIVPFLIDGQYAGAIGFDSLRIQREFDPAAVAALEIAASVVGAALQREQLIDDVRRERANAAEQRAAELARTNAALRSNIERLASQPADFFGHVLLETARQAGANAATMLVQRFEDEEWQVGAHVHEGRVQDAPFATAVPRASADFMQCMLKCTEPKQFDIQDGHEPAHWPEFFGYHRQQRHRTLYVLPLVFGDRTVGVMVLAFRDTLLLVAERFEMLIALAQQATLAIGMKRYLYSAKQAAVLAERNRIGQEIHDGLAQAFTGVLLQVGAAEEMAAGTPLAPILDRVRDIAREGLSEARRSVLALSPDEPRPGGLALALRQLAERSTVPNRTLSTFEGGNVATGLPPEHEHALLRIAQEAVINAIRHGQPRNVRIVLEGEAHAVQLRVTDDGIGMDQQPERCALQGFGLTNMRARAEAIGGEWQIDSRPGDGTRVSVRIPRRIRA